MKDKRQSSHDETMGLEAAEWFARLQEPQLSEDDLLGWERWMTANPEHRELFAELESVWRKIDVLEDISLPEEEAVLVDDYQGDIPVTQWRDEYRPETPAGTVQVLSTRRKRVVQLAAAATIAALAVVTGLWQTGWLSGTRSTGPLYAYQTDEAEHRNISLSDGSSIVLGAKSSLSASYMPHRRTVVLERGEALFQVARDSTRPFVVIAGSGTITAVGTAFNVRRDTQRVVVTVTEGKVRVARANDEISSQVNTPVKRSEQTSEQATLIQGQQIRYNTQGKLGKIAAADPEEATAWREGHLRFRNEPLQYVIDDVNRYTSKEIIIVDSTIEKLVFTGTVFNDQIDDWINGLADIFPVKVVKMDDEKLLITLASYQREARDNSR